jgi:FKBP-type peptidyl-prolyl cis-trans isomerase
MKRIVLALSALSLVLAAGCAGTKGSVPPPSAGEAAPAAVAADNAADNAALSPEAVKAQWNKFSYAVGVDFGTKIKRDEIPMDVERLSQGLRDSLGIGGGKVAMTDNEVLDNLRALQKDLNDRQAKKVHEMMRKNRADGQAYLDANEKKEGVKKTASGLQYRVIKEGTGKTPKPEDTVTVNYKGTFIDGKEFDSSYKRNEPASFPVNGVISGWTEGLQTMKEGGKSEFSIPSHLAYGEQGAGAAIPPNATLLFEVELLKVQGPDAPAAEPAKDATKK